MRRGSQEGPGSRMGFRQYNAQKGSQHLQDLQKPCTGRGFRSESTTTQAFKKIGSLTDRHAAKNIDSTSLKAVVIGGGTGAPVSIRTLLALGVQTAAVVAMADDGGSTGILREEAHVTPPGDIRKCLAAFASNPDDPLTKAFKYRFDFARNHTLGNLMLSALENATGSFPEAIKICEQLLGARGHVYPSTLNNVTLCACTVDGRRLCGQARACKSSSALETVWLESPEECLPYMEAIRVIRQADFVILGPGSLFTSIIPNLLVPGIADAIKQSKAKTIFVCSLADQQGETWGLSAREHVEALLRHGMQGCLDYVLVHASGKPEKRRLSTESFEAIAGSASQISGLAELKDGKSLTEKIKIRSVKINQEDIDAIQAQGPVVLLRDMKDPQRPTWHDPEALADAFMGVFRLCRSRQK